MTGRTRKSIDESQAYVSTMDVAELWEYFCKNDNFIFKDGSTLKGFMPNWIGEFYAYYQWYYDILSSEVIKKVPLDFLIKAYNGLHDLELNLAVKKLETEILFLFHNSIKAKQQRYLTGFIRKEN